MGFFSKAFELNQETPTDQVEFTGSSEIRLLAMTSPGANGAGKKANA
jgi:hypothetical protein